MTTIKGVYVIADPDLLPSYAQYPCIGLKDGKVSRSEGISETVNLTEEVIIYIYVQLLQNSEASIMGVDNIAPVADVKGLLDYEADLHAALQHNLLGDIVQSAFCPEELPSETMLAGENIFIQKKGCRYVFES